jgi:hypothetical protein
MRYCTEVFSCLYSPSYVVYAIDRIVTSIGSSLLPSVEWSVESLLDWGSSCVHWNRCFLGGCRAVQQTLYMLLGAEICPLIVLSVEKVVSV